MQKDLAINFKILALQYIELINNLLPILLRFHFIITLEVCDS